MLQRSFDILVLNSQRLHDKNRAALAPVGLGDTSPLECRVAESDLQESNTCSGLEDQLLELPFTF